MKTLILILFLLPFGIAAQEICEMEERIIELVNEYRVENGLEKLEHSPTLTFIAQVKVRDLTINHDYWGDSHFNPDICMHSWSDRGPWKPFHYTKVQELTPFENKGRQSENIFFATYSRYSMYLAEEAVRRWKRSFGHNRNMLRPDWKYIGVGVYPKESDIYDRSYAYAALWFSTTGFDDKHTPEGFSWCPYQFFELPPP